MLTRKKVPFFSPQFFTLLAYKTHAPQAILVSSEFIPFSGKTLRTDAYPLSRGCLGI